MIARTELIYRIIEVFDRDRLFSGSPQKQRKKELENLLDEYLTNNEREFTKSEQEAITLGEFKP